MTLKKNQIEDYEKKVKDADADNVILEKIAETYFVHRMARYGKMLAIIDYNFVKDAEFTQEEAFELTKIVLDFLLNSGTTEMSSGKTEPGGYA